MKPTKKKRRGVGKKRRPDTIERIIMILEGLRDAYRHRPSPRREFEIAYETAYQNAIDTVREESRRARGLRASGEGRG